MWTYDIWRPYIIKDRSDGYYLRVGRIVTVVGILIGVGTAFIASGYNNIMNYIQLLFSYFNAPLFATFIIAMFWKRTSPKSGVYGLAAGTLAAAIMHFAAFHIGYFYPGGSVLSHDKINLQMANFYGAIAAFVIDAIVTVAVTLVTPPKPSEELAGLVYGIPDPDAPDPAIARRNRKWWESPALLGWSALGLTAVLSIVFL